MPAFAPTERPVARVVVLDGVDLEELICDELEVGLEELKEELEVVETATLIFHPMTATAPTVKSDS
jgi:hypothetical protein